MLDKGQITDWDGEPEAPVPNAPRGKDAVEQLLGAREAIPTGERVTLTPEQVTARKRRGQWIALALFAFVILVFVLTMAKVGGGIPERM
ncbi:MAG: hypothetical protein R3C46_12295 [Hyphomonadaceae bacterium]